MSDQRYEYYAFISYSHKDEKWAKWLHKKLENYRLPSAIQKEHGDSLPKPPYKVFRDTTDLNPGPLRENLHRELEDSRFLIVICSPHSARPNTDGKHWVNDEVRRFIELGRADRIVPFIVDGKPDSNDPKCECLPPAIKENHILGTNINGEFGKEGAFIHVVAKMLGLKFDYLYQRHIRMERRKRYMKFALAAVLLLAVGLTWDFLREKTAYYADYVEINAVPKGLFRLDMKQVRHRHASWKIVGRHWGWKVDSVAYVNSAGVTIDINDTELLNRAPLIKNFYGENGRVIRREICNRIGRTVKIGTYKPDLKYVNYSDRSERGSLLGETLVKNSDFDLFDPEKRKSAVGGWELVADSDGRIHEVQYKNYTGKQPASDTDGVFGLRYAYSKTGQVSSITFLDRDGNPTLVRGIAGESYEYDPNGNCVCVTRLNLSGEKIVDRNVVSQEKENYDEFGNQIEDLFVGADGNPIINRRMGYAKATARFDERGNLIEMSLFDENGQPIIGDGYFAKAILKHDERGNQIEDAYFGTDGKTVYNKEGYAKSTAQYDDRGNLVEVAVFGVDGKPIIGADGSAKSVARYDEWGDQVELTLFGVDEKPIVGLDGFAKRTVKADELGNPVEEKYFGVDGEPIENRDGWAKSAAEYDDGNLTKLALYGADGKPIIAIEGYSVLSIHYDGRGNPEEEMYFGTDGKPIRNKNGFAKSLAKYEQGNEVERAYFAVDGKLTFCVDGYAKRTSKYDEIGRGLEAAYWGTRGELVFVKKYGCAKRTNKYDEHGKLIEDAYFGADGKLINNKIGYAKWTGKYDGHGNQIEEAYFGEDGKPAFNKQTGYAKAVAKYDNRGHLIERETFGADGRPLTDNDAKSETYGAAKWACKYDDHGYKTEMAYFGVDGKPMVRKDGFSKWTALYDQQGHQTEIAYFGVDGKPAIFKTLGYAKSVAQYDKRGHLIERATFGVGGKRIAIKDGSAKWTCKFDEQDHVIEWAIYGVDGKLAVCRDASSVNYGASKSTFLYDQQGRLKEMEFYGSDGAPLESSGGYARRQIVRDATGKTSETYYYDRFGVIVLKSGPNGVSRPSAASAEYLRKLNKKMVPIVTEFVGDNKSIAKMVQLHLGDILLDYDGVSYDGGTTQSVMTWLERFKVGSNRSRILGILRDGKRVEVRVPKGKLGVGLDDATFEKE